jgi:hypothetical protein
LLDELSPRLGRVVDGASLTSIIFDGGEKGRMEERGKSKKIKFLINGFKKKR